MPEAVVNKPFTFQVLFVDDFNVAMIVAEPKISVFSFSAVGVKQIIVDNQPMLNVQPAEVGRYTYTMTIPGVYTDGDTLYAEMRALDVGNGNAVILVSDELQVISANRGLGSSGIGMRTSFIK